MRTARSCVIGVLSCVMHFSWEKNTAPHTFFGNILFLENEKCQLPLQKNNPLQKKLKYSLVNHPTGLATFYIYSKE